ncbi:hypothetical protein BDW42DRAFT_69148 [Aspergillus taichungensis]|uniref:Uncharacterized protein n=1 Tax=Aspergillus taichungensis TaxID=482145 RepID=A0A2J5I063_9EURO|nr:hypothetical protein BDW42DRAFT_69148 [Aspergillus taichungensis]
MDIEGGGSVLFLSFFSFCFGIVLSPHPPLISRRVDSGSCPRPFCLRKVSLCTSTRLESQCQIENQIIHGASLHSSL